MIDCDIFLHKGRNAYCKLMPVRKDLVQCEKPVYYANTLKGREESKSGKRMYGSSMGHGKVPLLSLWKALRVANRSEASGFHIQEAYDRCHTKDAKTVYQNMEL